jgi:hypothetical protein
MKKSKTSTYTYEILLNGAAKTAADYAARPKYSVAAYNTMYSNIYNIGGGGIICHGKLWQKPKV